MSQGKIVGIDLGTTHSLVAVMEGAEPVLIPGAMGHALTPSVVAVTPLDEVIVGRAAREMAASNPTAVRAVFKREMGTNVEHLVRGRKMSPQLLSGIVLRRLREDAEEYLGEPVRRAVVTVPAYFDDAQRQATMDAGELAGLEIVRVLNEPTAAALAYGIHADPAPRKLLVFDLGGGTFDISIVDCEDGIIEVCASAGEAFLGGEDFTRRLVARLLARHELSVDEFEARSPLLFAKLRYRVELAKLALSESTQVSVSLPDPDVRDGSYVAKWVEAVTRDDLAAAGKPLVERFRPVTWRALRDAGLRPDEIDDVLLVGGASRMVLVREFLVEMFGREPRCDIDPDTVVAMGAAVQAALVEGHSAVDDIVATDVMPHTLGTEVSREIGSKVRSGIFLPIIERNTTIPVSRTTTLSTMQDGQTEMIVDVYQGESRNVSENLCLGKLRVADLPARPKGRESIDVRFTYDLNGILEVEVKTVSTGAVQRMVLEQRPGKLSPKELQRALRAMKDLKVELRDRDAYRFVLAKAQRMFAEFLGPYRQRLGELIDQLEYALSDGDADAIESFRTELEIVMSLLEGDGGAGSDGR